MTLRQLELLRTVLEHGGYLAAGEHLRLASSAVHRQVKRLEQEVGARLLVRAADGGGVRLTEMGRILADLSCTLDLRVKEARDRIADLRNLRAGRLRIGTGTTTLVYFLPTVLAGFRELHPGIDLQVMTAPADDVLGALRAGTLDLGIISAAPDRHGPESGFVTRRLYTERFVFVESADRRSVAAQPLICLSRGTRVRAAIDTALATIGDGPEVTMELENEEAIVRMVELGFGMGIVASRRIESTALKQCSGPVDHIDVDVVAVYALDYVSERVRAFLALCDAQAAREAFRS